MLGALYKAGVTGELIQRATPHEHGMFVHYYQGVVSGAPVVGVDLEDVSGEVKTIRNQATQKYGYFKYKGQVVLDQFLKKPVPRLPVGDMIRVTEWILNDSKKVGWGDDPALRKRRLDILSNAELAMMSFVKANAKRLNIEPGTDAYFKMLSTTFYGGDIDEEADLEGTRLWVDGMADWWAGIQLVAVDLSTIDRTHPLTRNLKLLKDAFVERSKEVGETIYKGAKKVGRAARGAWDWFWGNLKWILLIVGGFGAAYLLVRYVEARKPGVVIRR